jgi:uncharacterized MnhB-related membrane protein
MSNNKNKQPRTPKVAPKIQQSSSSSPTTPAQTTASQTPPAPPIPVTPTIPVVTPAVAPQNRVKRWARIVIFLSILLFIAGAIVYLFSQEGIISHILGSALSILAACDLALGPALLGGPLKTFFTDMLQTTEKVYAKWTIVCLLSVNILVLLITVFSALFLPLIQADIFKTESISGKVQCAGGEQVVGIWVDAINGGSGFADWIPISNNGSEASFKYILPNGGDYNLHVGCGGTKQDWGGTYTTETGSGTVRDTNTHYFVCQDFPGTQGYGSCQLQN